MRLTIAILIFSLVASIARADFDAAVIAYDSGRYDIVHEEFSLLSERGDSRAEFMLGAMHFYGK